MNIVQLKPSTGSYLGSAHFYREPDGSISTMVLDMATWEIEAEPTIASRFTKFANWLRQGADSLEAQAEEFIETKEDAE